jgi:lysophospholipase L1-like esterase
MLGRFSTDILGHGYTRVVILAGTNDIFLASSPDIPAAVANVETMAQMASSAGMEVVLCTLPANESNPGFYTSLYAQFNQPITAFATANGYPLVDYYSLTTNLCLGAPTNCPAYYLPGDGIHPGPAGYAAMEAALAAKVTQ